MPKKSPVSVRLNRLNSHRNSRTAELNSRRRTAPRPRKEHVVTLLLVGDYGVLLGVAAQAYAFSELVHCVYVVNPVSVHTAEKFVTLNLLVVNLIFFISLEDDLAKRFGGENMKRLYEVFKIDDDQCLQSKMLTRS